MKQLFKLIKKYEVVSVQGLKDYMEDTYYVSDNISGGYFLGVYDGHKGGEASEYAKKYLHKFFTEEIKNGPEQAFKESYKKVADALEGSTSGTTAVNAYIKDKNITWANAGDSHAVVIKGDGSVTQLTEDHRLENPKEASRVKDAGGVPVNGYAMKGDYGIEPTRALGDDYFKSVGVLSIPATGKYKIEKNDRHLVLGSDGLFDFIQNKELGRFLIRFKEIKKASEELKKEIIENKKGGDNLTFIILPLHR